MYIGGNLYYESDDSEVLVYNAGRDLSRSRDPQNIHEQDVWLKLSNVKAALVP